MNPSLYVPEGYLEARHEPEQLGQTRFRLLVAVPDIERLLEAETGFPREAMDGGPVRVPPVQARSGRQSLLELREFPPTLHRGEGEVKAGSKKFR